MQDALDIDFTLRFESAPKGTIYLSVSWQPDAGKDFGYRLIRWLDEAEYLAIGDTKGFAEMDSARINRIMSHADAFLSLLPYRPDKPSKTSAFMLDELEFAVELGLPIGIIYDVRIGPSITDEPSKDSVLIDMPDGRQVIVPREQMVVFSAFEFGVRKSEELQLVELSESLDKVRSPESGIRPYAFLICRLQPDFQLPREACLIAAERGSGIPCYWIDSKDYASNIDDTVERARLLIKNASFVIAEISLTDENPDFDNPSRAHEIGLATAYRRKVFPVSHVPRRHPYHGLVVRQLVWWESEEDLFQSLFEAVHAERASIGRHVYNWELEDGGYTPRFRAPRFEPDGVPWQPPMTTEGNHVQSWVYAVSFGVIVFSVALILRHGVGYDDTLDLVAILAGVMTFMFSSRISRRVYAVLSNVKYLRWLVPTIASLLLVATVVFLRPDGSKGGVESAKEEVLQENDGQREGQQQNAPDIDKAHH